jgi:hypothetical protein
LDTLEVRRQASPPPYEEKEHGMGRLAQTEGLTDVQQEILAAVREFVDNEIIPVANELEHADEYPT